MLFFVALCACSPGGGCAGPKRHAEQGEQTPAAALLPRQRRLEAEGTVVRVRDGDSIVVLRDGIGVEVRLDGIDCPELAQSFGRKAKRFTSDLVFKKSVRLVGKGKDRYGRELAEVLLPDGRSLNRVLVAAGLAWWYSKYSTDRSLETLERTARSQRRGLWVDPDPVPPWDFRVSGQRPSDRRRSSLRGHSGRDNAGALSPGLNRAASVHRE